MEMNSTVTKVRSKKFKWLSFFLTTVVAASSATGLYFLVKNIKNKEWRSKVDNEVYESEKFLEDVNRYLSSEFNSLEEQKSINTNLISELEDLQKNIYEIKFSISKVNDEDLRNLKVRVNKLKTLLSDSKNDKYYYDNARNTLIEEYSKLVSFYNQEIYKWLYETQRTKVKIALDKYLKYINKSTWFPTEEINDVISKIKNIYSEHFSYHKERLSLNEKLRLLIQNSLNFTKNELSESIYNNLKLELVEYFRYSYNFLYSNTVKNIEPPYENIVVSNETIKINIKKLEEKFISVMTRYKEYNSTLQNLKNAVSIAENKITTYTQKKFNSIVNKLKSAVINIKQKTIGTIPLEELKNLYNIIQKSSADFDAETAELETKYFSLTSLSKDIEFWSIKNLKNTNFNYMITKFDNMQYEMILILEKNELSKNEIEIKINEYKDKFDEYKETIKKYKEKYKEFENNVIDARDLWIKKKNNVQYIYPSIIFDKFLEKIIEVAKDSKGIITNASDLKSQCIDDLQEKQVKYLDLLSKAETSYKKLSEENNKMLLKFAEKNHLINDNDKREEYQKLVNESFELLNDSYDKPVLNVDDLLVLNFEDVKDKIFTSKIDSLKSKINTYVVYLESLN